MPSGEVLKILLSVSSKLSGGRREAVEAGIKRAGEVVVGYKKRGGNGDGEEELGKVEGTDVLVTRHHHGTAYLKVYPVLSHDLSSSPWLMLFVVFFKLVGAEDDNDWHNSCGCSTSNHQMYSSRPLTGSYPT
jgi:hypothetical protein